MVSGKCIALVCVGLPWVTIGWFGLMVGSACMLLLDLSPQRTSILLNIMTSICLPECVHVVHAASCCHLFPFIHLLSITPEWHWPFSLPFWCYWRQWEDVISCSDNDTMCDPYRCCIFKMISGAHEAWVGHSHKFKITDTWMNFTPFCLSAPLPTPSPPQYNLC